MSDQDSSNSLQTLTANTAKDFLNRGGWTREQAVLIFNGLDPNANQHLFKDEGTSSQPMVTTYWLAVQDFMPGLRVVSVDDWLRWAIKGPPKAPREKPLTFSLELQEALMTADYTLLVQRLAYPLNGHGNGKPWLVVHKDDPDPKSPWHTPARYFARQLVKENPLLASKRGKLAEQVAQVLKVHGIYKRGGHKVPDALTIVNAFSGVNLRR